MPAKFDHSKPSTAFAGFPVEAFKFFTELDEQQTREWFQANRERYDNFVVHPLALLLESLTEALARRDLPLRGDPKTSVFRINRDVRFSKDKRPYKAHASAVLSRDGSKHSQGLVYLQIGPEECFVAAGFYALEPGPLDAFRSEIVEQPERWRSVVAKLASHGHDLMREGALARLPRGYSAEQVGSHGEDVRLKSFVVRAALAPKVVRSAELIDVVTTFAESSRPLLDFGWSALQKIDPAAP